MKEMEAREGKKARGGDTVRLPGYPFNKNSKEGQIDRGIVKMAEEERAEKDARIKARQEKRRAEERRLRREKEKLKSAKNSAKDAVAEGCRLKVASGVLHTRTSCLCRVCFVLRYGSAIAR
jgi:hypothetical protein